MSDVFEGIEVQPANEEFTHWSPSPKILNILKSTYPDKESGKARIPTAVMTVKEDMVTKVQTQLRKNANHLGYGLKSATQKNVDGTVTIRFAAKDKTVRKPGSKTPGRKPGQKNAPKPGQSAQAAQK